ncbi:hypothetical protein E4U30_008272 [Claviceps sp. LM220 group G6]|nr:hypothetical protein E4U30_008272 [Claviceps sp. LM220 group G6]KAG6106247.1 hypothetical protein E4U31_000904 [Claviceps sp. LM219 group G6]KAG6122990.1 hypothetical protein E4U14_002362 [Claviceps sp. LM454 group G7]
MRIAIAGGGGLGYLLAWQLSQADATYHIIILSTSARPEFSALNIHVYIVDYNNHSSLSYALQGTDIVISTISGAPQLNLINAAALSRTRTFIPSEFEGSLSKRPSRHDPLNRSSSQAISLLQYWEDVSRMRYTVFACGIFMERFHPQGLGYLDIGFGSGVPHAGDYLLNIKECTAEYADRNTRGRTVRVCLTSVYDLVRFVGAALELGTQNWPREFTMWGDRMPVRDVVRTYGRVMNVELEHLVRDPADLQALLVYYAQIADGDKVAYYQRLVATMNGRYDFCRASLNEVLGKSGAGHVQPMTFAGWLGTVGQSP